MSDDKLDKLFSEAGVPEPNELVRARIKREAMAAFISASSQGKDEASRLTETTSVVNRNERSLFMQNSMKNRMWIGSIAASLAMVIVLVVVKQMPRQPDGDSTAVVVNQTITDTTVTDTVITNTKVVDKALVDKTAPAETAPAKTEAVIAASAKPQPAAVAVVAAQASAAKKDKQMKAYAEEQVARRDALAAREREATASYAAAPAAAEPQALAKMQAGAASTAMMFEADSQAWPQQENNRDRFSHPDESTVKLVSEEPVSTFSIDVDTASYSFVRRQLNRGVLPAQDAVRVEEMINYFDYQYPVPSSSKEPFATQVHVLPSPWRPGNKLVHIAIKGYEISKQKQPDSNLVFLLDVSGSMDSPDKLPLVKQSMSLLLESLKATDTVAIVVYAGAAGVVLEPTKVKDKTKIFAALEHLQAGGSTAGGEGLALAYQLAERNFKKDAVNRIILATDGDFNVGVTQDERLEDFVTRKRNSGIYLSVLGFGEGNYQDALMQTLAQNGNGVAAYIDTLGEAQKILVDEASSALFPIATDVKIQVEFNPAAVAEYRLIGYETRALNREDFNNDKVDAGDIGAGHSVTAIYEITPVDAKAKLLDDSRYQKEAQVKTSSDELGFLKLRYKRPGENESKLVSTAIVELKAARELTAAEKKLIDEAHFAIAVAGFAQILRGGKYTGEWDYDQVIELAQKTKGDDAYGYRTEFIQLVRKAKVAKGM